MVKQNEISQSKKDRRHKQLAREAQTFNIRCNSERASGGKGEIKDSVKRGEVESKKSWSNDNRHGMMYLFFNFCNNYLYN